MLAKDEHSSLLRESESDMENLYKFETQILKCVVHLKALRSKVGT